MDRKFENITILLALALIVILFLLAYVFTPKQSGPVSTVSIQDLDGQVPLPLSDLVNSKSSGINVIQSQMRKLSNSQEQAVLVFAATEPLGQIYLYFKNYFKSSGAELTKDVLKDNKFALNALKKGINRYNIFGEAQMETSGETTLVNISLVTAK